jgi:hypothetical protein
MYPSFAAIVTSRKYNKPTRLKPLLLTLNLLEQKLSKIGRNKSLGSDGIPGGILKFAWKATTPYLARLLEISLNNATIQSDWKRATVVSLYKGGDLSTVTSYRPIGLTSVVCKQL